MKIEDIKYSMPNEAPDETNFDVNEWRKDNPVDYLKAVYLISSSPDKNNAFKAIYRVMRMYIPNSLYKYYSLTDDVNLNNQKFDTLLNKKIFMSESKYLNDPFDNKSFFYKPDRLKKFKRLKKHNGKLIDDFSLFNRITSLTANKTSSMPMWAHYSNNHAGFCVEYDMKSQENFDLYSCTFPVQYTDQRIDITSMMEQQAKYIFNELEMQSSQGKREIVLNDLSLAYVQSFFCNIKHISWSYENEFRCSMGMKAMGMPFVNAFPKGIYIGLNCNSENSKRLIKIADSLNVPIYKMKFDEYDTDFNLFHDKI